jgi:hypothetical protein
VAVVAAVPVSAAAEVVVAADAGDPSNNAKSD